MSFFNLLYQGLTKYAKSDKVSPQGTGFGSLRVAAFEPDYLELCRSGRLYAGGITIATNGVATVQDFPTTSASVAVYNNSPGKVLVPVRLGVALSGGTSGTGFTLLAGVTPGPIATPVAANSTGCTVTSLRGGTVGNVAYVATAQAVPTMAAQFAVVGGMETLADTTVGPGNTWDVAGMFVVPYGYALATAVLSGAGTSPKYMHQCVFALLELDIDG